MSNKQQTVTGTAVVEISKSGNTYALNITPEVCSPDHMGVTIPISKKQFEALTSLDFEEE
jgi:hypothetical protein